MPMLMKKIALCLLLAGLSLAARPQSAYVPGDILVMLGPDASATALARGLATVNGSSTAVHVVREVSAPMRAWLFHFDTAAVEQEAMLRAFRARPEVQMAQNNHVIRSREVPNDPNYGSQWQHQNINSEAAWDISTGGVTAAGDTIVVAIIEDADLTHPDLAANAWVNHHEVPDNGVDDDGNGYVDDVHGWNPTSDDDDVYGGPHGTEVAGMIGAVGDNSLQVVGANWHVKMMPVVYASAEEADVLESYTYPLVMRRQYNSTNGALGAFVVVTNASWGVDGGQPSEAPLWCAMYDTLGTAGVLSCGATANNNVDVDVVGDLPTACPSDYLITVTATNSSDMRTFSGYGDTTIDVGAPGQNVLTTSIGGGTTTTSGTSFASPLTAGVVALLYSVPCPGLAAVMHNDPVQAALQVRQALLDGVDQAGNLPGQTVTGGRINAGTSMQLLLDSCVSCPVPYNLALSSTAIGQATLTWSALPGTYDVRYRVVGTGTWTEVDDISDSQLSLSGLLTCQPYEFQVAAHCDSTSSTFGQSFFWTSEGCCTAPLTITVAAIDTSSATVIWSSVLASSDYDLRYRTVGTTDWTELDQLTGNGTELSGLASCSDQEVQMRSTCGGTTAEWSAPVTVHIPGCGQCMEGNFCNSSGNAFYEWIAQVQLAAIDRTSGSDNGYAGIDVTGQSAALVIGAHYPITLTPGYSTSAFEEYFTVWMDLDRDGQFAADEKVFDPGATVTAALNDTLVVPADATPGPVRIRVVMEYNQPTPNGCTSFDFGETEDYCATLSTYAGIAEPMALSTVRPYPQPADDAVHFTFSTPVTGDLRITDVAGRQLMQVRVSGASVEVPVRDLAEGLYTYTLVQRGARPASGVFIVVH